MTKLQLPSLMTHLKFSQRFFQFLEECNNAASPASVNFLVIVEYRYIRKYIEVEKEMSQEKSLKNAVF